MPTQNFARLKKTFDDDGFVVVRGYCRRSCRRRRWAKCTVANRIVV